MNSDNRDGSAAESLGGPFRLMICDDSAVVRGLIARDLEAHPEIRIIRSVSNGRQAIEVIQRLPIEVCILDIEMPIMDGMTALPRLIELRPDMQIIVASTSTLRNADLSLRALAAGAADYITKPSTISAGIGIEDFRIELVAKVKALAAARRRIVKEASPPDSARGGEQIIAPRIAPPPPPLTKPHVETVRVPLIKEDEVAPPVRVLPMARRRIAEESHQPITLRAPSSYPAAAIAIGSSTGGPQALFKLLGDLRGHLSLPIFITQHMPPAFTTILAEHITRITGMQAIEAVEGTEIRSGLVYVAQGDHHLTIVHDGDRLVVHASKEAAENFCRPSVDPMMRSLARIYGKNLLAIILTGMGNDGARGCQDVVAAGGTVIAQDEVTSTVWGMPYAVARAGLCSKILPLSEIADEARRLVARAAA